MMTKKKKKLQDEPEVRCCSKKDLRREGVGSCATSRPLKELLLVAFVLLVQPQYLGALISDAKDASDLGRAAAGAQYVAPEKTQPSTGSTSASPNSNSNSNSSALKSLDDFLESLPMSSVGQKHTANFECELDRESGANQLLWLRLVRPKALSNDTDITPLTLNRRLITPDKRFRVRFQPPRKWILTIEGVGPADHHAYYLCQVGGGTDVGAAGRFLGGARLNVLAPPRIVETETSPSVVVGAEFEPLRLQCKVESEPRAQLTWRREDGRSLDGLEQRFRHQLVHRSLQLLSVDSSELLFERLTREHKGAYLCIASNGVQTGVSQRIELQVEKCRTSAAREAPAEPCSPPPPPSERPTPEVTSTTPVSPTRTSGRRAGGWRLAESGLQRARPQRVLADKRQRNELAEVSIRQQRPQVHSLGARPTPYLSTMMASGALLAIIAL